MRHTIAKQRTPGSSTGMPKTFSYDLDTMAQMHSLARQTQSAHKLNELSDDVKSWITYAQTTQWGMDDVLKKSQGILELVTALLKRDQSQALQEVLAQAQREKKEEILLLKQQHAAIQLQMHGKMTNVKKQLEDARQELKELKKNLNKTEV